MQGVAESTGRRLSFFDKENIRLPIASRVYIRSIR
jgi:hypothetical protein